VGRPIPHTAAIRTRIAELHPLWRVQRLNPRADGLTTPFAADRTVVFLSTATSARSGRHPGAPRIDLDPDRNPWNGNIVANVT
jgi:hypothetical protein